jgi:hypothetical protein
MAPRDKRKQIVLDQYCPTGSSYVHDGGAFFRFSKALNASIVGWRGVNSSTES